MQILDSLGPMWGEIKGGVEMSMPMLMKAAMVYLGIRFALVISSVIVRLGVINSPLPPAMQPIDPAEEQLAGSEETGNRPRDGQAALPERTSGP